MCVTCFVAINFVVEAFIFQTKYCIQNVFISIRSQMIKKKIHFVYMATWGVWCMHYQTQKVCYTFPCFGQCFCHHNGIFRIVFSLFSVCKRRNFVTILFKFDLKTARFWFTNRWKAKNNCRKSEKRRNQNEIPVMAEQVEYNTSYSGRTIIWKL